MEQRPKLAVITAVLAGFSVVFSAFPSHSNGSLGIEPRVIVVKPSREIRRQSEIRRMEKSRQAAEKAEAKADAAAEKARVKAREKETKAYEKRLAAQKKKK